MGDIFSSKIAVVTGAASGLGAALAKELVSAGATVIIADAALDKAQQVAAAIGPNAHAFKLDVTNPEELDALAARVKADFGTLDFFFNNAGTSVYGSVADLPLTEWDRVLKVNLMGVIFGSLCAYRLMKEQGWGTIVNIASGSVFTCDPIIGPYVTSKFGVFGFTRGLRIEAEPDNVRVYLVCPGNIRTPLLDLKEPSWLTPAIPVEEAARHVLNGVSRRRTFIVFPFRWRLLWLADRLNPHLLDPLRRIIVRRARSRMSR